MNVAPQTSRPVASSFIWGVLVILSACVVATAFGTREYFIDDAFIGFQYVRNLLAGHGFVYWPGDAPVEGATNIGWLLTLAPLCTIAEPTVVAKLAGLALVLMTMILTVCLGQQLAVKVARPEDSCSLIFFPVLMLVVSFDFLYFSLSGMETALLATILMLMACAALGRPRSMLLPALGAFAFLVHPEAVAVYPFYAALGWLRSKDDRRALAIGCGIFVGLLGGVTAVRFAYFHDVVPNTFHSKPSDLGLAVENAYAFLMGQNTNVAFPVTGWLAIPVLLLGYRRLRRAAPATADMLAAICSAGLLFAIYSPPDWSVLPRYFAPYLPAALILLWAGLTEAVWLLWGANMRPHTGQTVTAVVALALVLTSVFDGRAKMARMDDFPGYVLAGKNLVEPAVWMRDHLPADATIATRRIGALAYYTRRNVFDYTYGLPEPEVARLVAQHGRRFDTPTDPALAPLWRDRAPGYLLEDGAMIDYIVSQAGGARERFSIHGIDYRVVKQFPIGREVQWVLAQRIAPE